MRIGLLMRHDKVYGFFHEDDETKLIVLIYSGDRTAEFSYFSYLVDGPKGVEQHYFTIRFKPIPLSQSPK